MSLGGRLTLINAVLSSIPIYMMSFYELSRWVIKRIGSLRKNFLWQGGEEGSKGYHLISWERVCKKNEFDGLEVLNLDGMNRALVQMVVEVVSPHNDQVVIFQSGV